MVKYFCDRCGDELKENDPVTPLVDEKHLCGKCRTKYNAVKHQLKYKELQKFFNMSDEDIALMMEYEFKVGDEVITSDGRVGIIESICECEGCKKRGFYEPQVKMLRGIYNIYITDTDKKHEFSNFYKIGKYIFGNVDKESVECDINRVSKDLEEFRYQLDLLNALGWIPKGVIE